MAPTYSKNAILKGTVDSFCLVCETYLRSEEDFIKHITKPVHKKKIDSTQYVKEFEEDCIRKVKIGYFCEFCNKLLTVMARVKMHVLETSHTFKKIEMCFERSGPNVIVFGKLLVNDQAWNGLKDDSCAICNTEYDNEDLHRNTTTHIINLTQCKTEIDDNKNLYRKIDDVLIQCLTCNLVLALSNKTKHFEGDDHKNQYQACLVIPSIKAASDKKGVDLTENLKDIDKQVDSKKIENSVYSQIPLNETDQQTESNTKTMETIDLKDEKTTYVVDDVKETDDANNPKSVDVDTAKDETKVCSENNHDEKGKIEEEKSDKNLKDTKLNQDISKINTSQIKGNETSSNKTRNSNIGVEEKKILKVLGADDYITLDERGKTTCILCDMIMSPEDKNSHLNGRHHKTMLKLHKKRIAEAVKAEPNTDLINFITEFQSNGVNINLEIESAVCKKCAVLLPYAVDAIKEHIAKHKDVKECNKENIPDEDLSAKKNETENEKNNTMTEPEKEESVKTEDKKDDIGAIKNKKTVNKKSCVDSKKPLVINLQKSSPGEFITKLTFMKFMIFNDVIINDKYCISFLSFILMTSKGNDLECLACKKITNVDHVDTREHAEMVNNTPIIINVEDEFVREINPNLLHCGYCNVIVFSWSDMEKHFHSPHHRNSKMESEWKLKMYLNEISENEKKPSNEEQRREMALLMHLFKGMF